MNFKARELGETRDSGAADKAAIQRGILNDY